MIREEVLREIEKAETLNQKLEILRSLAELQEELLSNIIQEE